MVVTRRTLLDFHETLAGIDADFVAYDDGYRTWSYTYAEVANASRAFAARLRDAGVRKSQAIVIWGENRPEWLIAMWGAILEGVVLVPIDYRASAAFLLRVAGIV